MSYRKKSGYSQKKFRSHTIHEEDLYISIYGINLVFLDFSGLFAIHLQVILRYVVNGLTFNKVKQKSYERPVLKNMLRLTNNSVMI